MNDAMIINNFKSDSNNIEYIKVQPVKTWQPSHTESLNLNP